MPVAHVPSGFHLAWIGKTGIAVVDGFCTPDEVSRLAKCSASGDIVNEQLLFRNDVDFSRIVARASMLLGLPAGFDTITIRRSPGSHRRVNHERSPFVVLLNLPDSNVAATPEVRFPGLNTQIALSTGRAIVFRGANHGAEPDEETRNELLWEAADTPMRILELELGHQQIVIDAKRKLGSPQADRGQALTGTEALPFGAVAPGDVLPDSDYAKAFRHMQ